MVKIPELTKDGQNWKIYCTKFLEVAATFDCLKVLAGRPYEGDDWDGCNALLCCMFMETVAPSIYFKICRRTAHENFKYLAKRFRNSKPIPRANEFQRAGTAAAAETPEKSPMSANAATERHAHAKSDEEDLSNSKALTRGTEDVDDGNVGRTEDPHTSFEALAKGTSAESAEMTLVVLESTPHETQDQPHSSLPLTPRPPIEGEPNGCKQEAVDSVVTAGRTKGMVEMAEPTEMVADVNRTALLGGEPVEMACEVDEGNGMERKDLRLPKAELYCEERHQHSGNATGDVPSAQKLLLKGEWTVLYASGKLLTTTVEPYANDGDRNARVYLGGTHWRAGDADRPGNRSDGSRYQADRLSCQTDGPRGEADASRAWMDTLKVSDSAETNVIGHEEGAGTYLSIGDAKHLAKETDGVGNHVDVLIGHGDVLSVNTDVIKPTDTPQIINEPNGLGDQTDTSSVHTYVHCIGNDAGAAENETLNIRKSQTIEKSQDSLYTAEIEFPKRSYRWRKVSVGNIDVYVPWNVPIEVLGRAFEFREVESAGKAIAPIVEGERAGNGDGS
ncbi:hypothetical protein SCLCIDRAFT_22720 [Scleroderma citrinum Foug A]|uniref:Uncharacterized protein n=1 Tax=Scleroderma citrinum Foug A TaxID=1036808 RepID=A0A0C3AKT5_9AGAM|nr:hypothetical protein SCLCIDRAFT_22720 [Scleroderma citrinum Foug A]